MGRCPQGKGLRTVVTGVGTGVVAAPVPGFGVGPGVCGPDVCMHITQHLTFNSNIFKHFQNIEVSRMDTRHASLASPQVR